MLESFRLLTIYLKPVLPAVAEKVEAFLNLPPLEWSDVTKPLNDGHAINPYEHLMQRVDEKMLEALFDAPQPANEEAGADEKSASDIEPLADQITIDDFAKVDMRIAKIAVLSKAQTSCCVCQSMSVKANCAISLPVSVPPTNRKTWWAN